MFAVLPQVFKDSLAFKSNRARLRLFDYAASCAPLPFSLIEFYVRPCLSCSGLERRLKSRVPRERGRGVPEGRRNLKPSEEDFWHEAGVYDYSEASSTTSPEVSTREPACGEEIVSLVRSSDTRRLPLRFSGSDGCFFRGHPQAHAFTPTAHILGRGDSACSLGCTRKRCHDGVQRLGSRSALTFRARRLTDTAHVPRCLHTIFTGVLLRLVFVCIQRGCPR